MRWMVLAIAATLGISGCATVIDEQRFDAVIQRGFNSGASYVIRVRTLQGPQGTYTQTSVLFLGRTATCDLNRPGDCDRVAQAIAERADFGNLGTSL